MTSRSRLKFVLPAAALSLYGASCCPQQPQVYEGRAFILAFERDGQCLLRLGPERFSAPPGAHVVWEIKNECGVDIEPEVHDFAFEGSLDGGQPTGQGAERMALGGIFEDPAHASQVVRGQGAGEIKLRIKEGAKPGRYNYSFRNLKAAGDPVDPKLDIWPPKV